MKRSITFLTGMLLTICLYAQQPSLPALSAAEKTKVVTTIAKLLQDNYVFPDKATAMGSYILQRDKAKAYRNIGNYKVFVDSIASDLRKVHQDLHMNVHFNPKMVADVRKWQAEAPPTAGMIEQQLLDEKRENFGFMKVEHLPGNVGYIDFRNFYKVNEASKNTVAAAMGFLANTDAVIIDLRYNSGGHPEMVQLVLSYFMDEKPIHYNSIYERPTNHTQDFHSLAEVKGEKMPQVELYVLTSNYTFSAAEELTYDLQNLKRATIVGETTGGGAHPTNPYVVNDQVIIHIPFARAINPFTKTNWEGTGVVPDVKVKADKALAQAQLLAVTKLASKTADTDRKKELAWRQQSLQAELTPPASLTEQQKQALVGTYGERTITLEKDELFYQRNGRPKLKMNQLDDKTFVLTGIDYVRFTFEKDATGTVEKLIAIYNNGTIEASVRSH